MTVKELIEKLETLPPASSVFIFKYNRREDDMDLKAVNDISVCYPTVSPFGYILENTED